MVHERWRRVPSHPNIEVSDRGRVRTVGCLPRKLTKSRPSQTGPTYQVVRITHGGKRTTERVHVLIASAFLGPRPQGMEVCHKNGDGCDNRAKNLRYDTPKGNANDKHAHGTALFGERTPGSKLSDSEVIALRREYAAGGATYRQLGQRYGISTSHAGGIIKRRFWAHLQDDGTHLSRDNWDAHRDHGSNFERKKKRLTAFGKTQTHKEWSVDTGLPIRVIQQRIKAGWTPEDVVGKPKAKRGTRVEAFGKRLTRREWADETGLSEKIIRNRIDLFGWEPERALSTSAQKQRGRNAPL